MAVQKAGDNIDVVKKVLIERNSTEAVKVINDIVIVIKLYKSKVFFFIILFFNDKR